MVPLAAKRDHEPGHPRSLAPLGALARGGSPVALPVLLQPGAVAGVFGTTMLTPTDTLPARLTAGALAWAVLMTVALPAMLAAGRRRAVAEMLLLGAAFAALPPLAAFALYFVGLHAPPHMAALAADLVLPPSLVRGLRKFSGIDPRSVLPRFAWKV